MSDRGLAVRETVDARKERYGEEDLRKLMKGAREVLVAKGKKSWKFTQPKSAGDWEEIAAVAVGPTGNLKAPTLRRGDKWVVGFGEEAWVEAFGG